MRIIDRKLKLSALYVVIFVVPVEFVGIVRYTICKTNIHIYYEYDLNI